MTEINGTILSEIGEAFEGTANIDQNLTRTSDRQRTEAYGYSWKSSEQDAIVFLDEQSVTSPFQQLHADFISREDLRRFMFHSAAVALAVGVFAMLCGVLNIVVSSSQRSDAYTRYLLGTNIGDTVSVFAFLQFLVVERLLPPTSLLFRVSGWYVETVAGTVCHRAAVSLNALASLERFLALVFPFRAPTKGVRDHPSTVVMATFSLTILGHLPLALEYNIVRADGNQWEIKPTQMEMSNPGIFAALKTAARVIFLYLPIIYSFVINVALVIALRLYASKNRQLGRNSIANSQFCLQDGQKDSKTYSRTKCFVKTTRLVLCLTLSFLCLVLPRTINATVSGLVSNYGFFTDNNNLFSVVLMLTNIAAYLTQPSLFVVSMFFSRQFRRTLSHVLWHARRGQKQSVYNIPRPKNET